VDERACWSESESDDGGEERAGAGVVVGVVDTSSWSHCRGADVVVAVVAVVAVSLWLVGRVVVNVVVAVVAASVAHKKKKKKKKTEKEGKRKKNTHRCPDLGRYPRVNPRVNPYPCGRVRVSRGAGYGDGRDV
jgi:hypothetical protein